MNGFKEKFSHLMKEIKKEKIKWEFTLNNGSKRKGEYEGEVKDGKPDGMGRWKEDGSNWVIEAEWKEGLLHGRAVSNFSDGTHEEYEAKNGKVNGKFISY